VFASNVYIKSALILASFIVSEAMYASMDVPSLVRWYGIISLFLLVAVMLPGPLYRLYPELPFKNDYRQSLGGLGISAFYFALLHSYLGFFFTLLGFQGLPFLSGIFLWALIVGLVSFLILAAMAATSFTWAMRELGPWWKFIHRFVYVAGIALIIHAILIGSDYRDLTQPIGLVSVIAVTVLVILQAISLRRYFVTHHPGVPSWIFTASISFILVGSYYVLYSLHEFIAGGHVH